MDRTNDVAGPLRRTRGGSRRWSLAAALAMVAGLVVPLPSAAVVDPSQGFLDDVPSVLPGGLGDVDLTTLQYGDPGENLAVLPAPEANDDGSAALALPLVVPAGRAGVQPDLVLQYDSRGGSSWLGQGWDLGVGAITIDSAFGAPRFDAAKETETYALDGDRLFPNAIRAQADLDDRVSDRSDFVRQVEGEFERIIRYGNAPGNYYWRVTDKDGTDRWYGASPDEVTGEVVRDEGAIIRTPGGVGTHWGLAYVEDISGNTMRVHYDALTGVQLGATSSGSPGVSLYLRSIEYTGFDVDDPTQTTAVDQPPYRIDFLRDGGGVRSDIDVDASAGVPVVTRELLDRIEIHNVAPDGSEQLVGGYDFTFDTDAPFDKTLLTTIGQVGADGEVFAEHVLQWYDELSPGDGFSDPVRWDVGTSDPDPASIVATSAISQANRLGGDGGAYIGFNPVVPQKTLSIGGSFNISGGETAVQGQLLDIDGDGLPDKVYLDGSTPKWQRNIVTPQTERTAQAHFAAARPISGIDRLGRTRDFKVDLALEAYPVASIQIGGGFGFDFVDEYFQDVNGDGRPDWVQANSLGGTVYFNTLVPRSEEDGGGHDVQFIASSTGTGVPLEPWTGGSADDGETAALIDAAQPRMDTVRRWVAPFTGTVTVTGTPTLTRGGGYLGDGAQVSVETFAADGSGGQRRFVETLDATTSSVSHDETFAVTAGDQVFFRLHVLDDVVDDEVTWAPVVTYSGDPDTTEPDANGRSQLRYDAAEDFTVFGRTGTRTALPDAGPATLALALTAAGGISDDVTVVVRHGVWEGDALTIVELDPSELSAGDVVAGPDGAGVVALEAGSGDAGTVQPLTYDFIVSDAPKATADTAAEEPDFLEVLVLSDTPVDPRSVDVDIDLQTTPPTSGEPLPQQAVIPSVRVFSVQDGTAPYQPWVPTDEDERELEVSLLGPKLAEPDDAGPLRTTAVLTVKRAVDGVVQVVARERFTVAHDYDGGGGNFRLRGSATLEFTPEQGVPHWLEVSAHEPGIAERLTVVSETVTGLDPDDDAETVDVRLHHPDVQGVFPSANRGWAAAGYNADHDEAAGAELLVPDAFEIDVNAPDGVPLDEDLDVEAGADQLDVSQLQQGGGLDLGGSFPRNDAYLPWAGPDGGAADRWRSAGTSALYATATTIRASRVGADLELATGSDSGGGGRNAPRLTTSKGDFALALGLGPASISGAFGAGSDLTGFDDLNGDGLPDVRDGVNVSFTGPRGDLARRVENLLSGQPGGQSVSVGGGLGASPVSAQVSRSGNHRKRGGTTTAPTSTSKKRGANIGLGFGIQSSWSNPLPASGVENADGFSAAQGELGDADLGVDKERVLVDVNGDGLADLVETGSTGRLSVRLGTGYGFASPVGWSRGTFNSTKDVTGTLSVGFQVVNYEFGGGAGGGEGVSLTEMQWADIDGDGVLDRFEQLDASGPTVTFGSANGMTGDEIRYGTYPTGSVDFVGNNVNLGEAIGQRASLARSTSASGGFDFSFYIGPICVVACYIVINPGAHFGGDRSTVEITLEDMNGDGHLDVVESKSRDQVSVRLNEAGRTNLLQSVATPVGGSYELSYERQGPTVEQPESPWLLSELRVDDGRPGDGPDEVLYRFSYEGNRYDRALRELYGFTTVIEQQLLPVDGGTPVQQRVIERTYANTSPFDAGLLLSEKLREPDGNLLAGETVLDADSVRPAGAVREETRSTYQLRGVAGSGDLGSLPAIGSDRRLELLDAAAVPLLVADELDRVDGEGDVLSSRTSYVYDGRGNPTAIVDENSPGVDSDDVTTTLTYPDGCGESRTAAAAADGDTWVQVPAVVTVTDAAGDVLRERDGSLDLCLNAVPIRIVASQGQDACGDMAYAVTELAFDDYGSYGSVLLPSNAVRAWDCSDAPQEAPAGDQTFFGCSVAGGTEQAVLDAAADAQRPCLDYVYDDHRFTDIASVTDVFGVTSTATYDPLTGRLATEVDPNGNTSLYCYDPQGRLASIVAPREVADAGVDVATLATAAGAGAACEGFLDGSDTATVSYDYSLAPGATRSAGGHAWATAAHRDAFGPDLIETATFIDGLGRVVQRKRDADVDLEVALADGSTTSVDVPVRVVEGAVEYDVLGREVKEWYPVLEVPSGVDLEAEAGAPLEGTPLQQPLTTYNTQSSSIDTANTTFVAVTQPTETAYDVLDRVTGVELPDGSATTVAHDVVLPSDSAVTVPASAPTTTDPLGAEVQRWIDVRGATLRVEERGADTTLPDGTAATLGGLDETAQTAIVLPEHEDGTTPPGGETVVTTFGWDSLVRLTSVTDTTGAATTHTYDMLDNRTSTTNPDTGTAQRRWSPLGQLGAEIDQVRLDLMASDSTPARRETLYEYDRDRLVGIDYPDVADDPRSITPDVTYTFGDDGDSATNANGRVTSVVDGAMTRGYDYDVDGNVAVERATRAQDPFGKGDTTVQPTHVTRFGYDSLARLRTLVYPDGETLTYHFDLGGAPERITAELPQPPVQLEDGSTVNRPDRAFTYVDQVGYDEFGEVSFLRTGTGVETSYDRDPARRRIVTIDTDAVATEQYDGTTSPARQLQRLRYGYDTVGNVVDTANTLYGADGATELATADAIPENGVPGPAQHAYTYDPHYRLVGAASRYVDRTEDRGLTYQTEYAANGTLLSKRQEATTVSTTGSSTSTTDTTTTDEPGKSMGDKEKDGSNAKKNREPDGDTGSTTPGQCSDNQGSGGGLDNQDPTLTYTLADGDLTYDEDASHRLVTAGSREYVHDANGSLLRWLQPCASTTEVQTHTWDADNRIVAIAQGTLKNTGRIVENATTEYRYNAEGVRTLETRPSETFFVNPYWRVEGGEQQYASIFLGGTRVAMHRTEVAPELPGPVEPCDPALEVCDPCDPQDHRCAEEDVAPGACDAPEVVRGEDGTTCEPLHREVMRFLHPDATGSMRVATDALAEVFQYIEYTPTGRPWVAGQSSVKDTPYLFAGGWTDNQFDLVNFGERWYDPREEQFLSVEPLLDEEPEAVLDDPGLLSAYTYAASNPLRFVDTDGRRPDAKKLWIPDSSGTGGSFNAKLDADQLQLLQEVPAWTITPKTKRREARERPAGGGPFTNDVAALQFLTDSGIAKVASKLDSVATFLSVDRDENGRYKIKAFSVRVNRHSGQPQSTSGTKANNPAGTNRASTPAATGGSGTSSGASPPPAGGNSAPPRPSTAAPAITPPRPVTQQLAGAAGAPGNDDG